MKTTQKKHLEAQYKANYVEGWDELLTTLKQYRGEMIIPRPEPKEHVEWFLQSGRIVKCAKECIGMMILGEEATLTKLLEGNEKP